MNANNNGAQVQVNPVECARNALQFLSRVSFTRAERQAFDQCEGLLAAIMEGQVVLQSPAPVVSQAVPTLTEPQKKTRARKGNGHLVVAEAPEGGQQNALI